MNKIKIMLSSLVMIISPSIYATTLDADLNLERPEFNLRRVNTTPGNPGSRSLFGEFAIKF